MKQLFRFNVVNGTLVICSNIKTVLIQRSLDKIESLRAELVEAKEELSELRRRIQ